VVEPETDGSKRPGWTALQRPDPELQGLRQQSHQTARSLLTLKDPESPLVQSELKRLNGEVKSLEASIRSIESNTTPTHNRAT
jgi:hypothetical protein